MIVRPVVTILFFRYIFPVTRPLLPLKVRNAFFHVAISPCHWFCLPRRFMPFLIINLAHSSPHSSQYASTGVFPAS
ncbi:hypothetical protein AC789_1c17410 [Escherichia coli]|nr:hypothetical protein AC789_1c17410 [Escherichia coli]